MNALGSLNFDGFFKPKQINDLQPFVQGLKPKIVAISHGLNRLSDSHSSVKTGLGVLAQNLQDKVPGQETSQGILGQLQSDFSPEKVADRVLSQVGQALQRAEARGASQDTLAGLLAQAKKGIEQGFRQAEQELEQLGILNDEVATVINDTHQRLQSGIEQLAEQFVKPVQQQTAASVSGVSSESRFQSESFSLQVKTRDGDLVTLNIQQTQASLRTQAVAVGQSGSGTSVSAASLASSYEKSQFGYTVQGELDQGELEALDELMGQVGQLADTFFSGNTQAAVEKAFSIGFDSSELVGFSLHLTQVQVQQSTQAYRAVQQFGPDGEATGLADLLESSLAALGDYVKGLLEAVNVASVFDQPEQAVNDLLTAMRAAQSTVDQLDDGNDSLSRLTEQLLGIVN